MYPLQSKGVSSVYVQNIACASRVIDLRMISGHCIANTLCSPNRMLPGHDQSSRSLDPLAEDGGEDEDGEATTMKVLTGRGNVGCLGVRPVLYLYIKYLIVPAYGLWR